MRVDHDGDLVISEQCADSWTSSGYSTQNTYYKLRDVIKAYEDAGYKILIEKQETKNELTRR